MTSPRASAFLPQHTKMTPELTTASLPPANAGAPATVEGLLRQLRNRLFWQRTARRLIGFGLYIASVTLLLAIVQIFAGAQWINALSLGLIALLAILWPLLYSALQRPSLLETARAADRVLGASSKDRLTSAWSFSQQNGEHDAESQPARWLAIQESARFLEGHDFHDTFPVGRRNQLYLLGPVAALAVGLSLFGDQLPGFFGPGPGAGVTDEERERADAIGQDLEKMAEELREQSDPALHDLADELEDAAEELAETEEDPQREAMRQLARLEASVREKLLENEKAARQRREMLNKLAKALQETRDFQEAGNSLAEGNDAESAQRLQDALEQLETDEQRAAAAEQLKQALARQDFGNNQQPGQGATGAALDPRIQELMNQLMSPENADVLRALQEMARQLQQMQQQQPQQQPGGQGESPAQAQPRQGQGQSQEQPQGGGGEGMTEEQLQRMLQALENLKERLRSGESFQMQSPSPSQQQSPGGSEQDQMSSEPILSIGPPSGQPGLPLPLPTGTPGGNDENRDTGTSDPLSDDPQNQLRDENEGFSTKLDSTQGSAGDVFQSLILGGPDNSTATQDYQRIYEANLPSIERAMTREDIPLGSRHYIKKYFESIRP